MDQDDTKPLESSPVHGKIRARRLDNRLGAVYAALHSFWTARQASSTRQRDANTVILHAQGTRSVCQNDTTRSPDDLLNLLLPHGPGGGNNFNRALMAADTAVFNWWDDDRPPVIIFLSDGIGSAADGIVQKLFHKAAQKGCVTFDCQDMYNSKLTFRAAKGSRCTPSCSVLK